MSSFDVGTAFVTVVPDTTKFRALLQAQVNAAVASVRVPGVAAGGVAGATNATASAMTNLSTATTVATGATAKEAAAALAVSRALETQRLAEDALTAAIARNADATTIQTLTNKAAIASQAATVATLRQSEALTKLGTSGKVASDGLLSARQEASILQGSIVGLSRITPVAVFGLGVAGSAAIAAGLAFKSAVTSAADFEQQLNTFQAVTKATAQDMEEIRAAAINLGADISLPAISAGDAADALTELAKAGLSVQDSLAAARGVLQLSSAANITAGQAAQIAATQLNAFQLAGSDATRVAELLADASVSAQGEITDFAAAFGQASAVANQVGLSIEDTTALLTQLGQAGLQGADGGTSLRTALLRLVPTTKEARQFTEALGIQIDKTKSIGEQIVPIIEQYRTQLEKLTPIQQQEVLTQIFGQDAIRAASILFTQQEGALRDLTDEFERNNSIQDLSAAKAKGLKGAIGSLQSTFETLGIELGGFVAGPLEDLIRGLNETVIETQNFLEFLDRITLSDQIEKKIKVIFEADAGPFGSIGKALGVLALGPAAAPIVETKVLLDLFGANEPTPPRPRTGPFFGEGAGSTGPGEDAIAAVKTAVAAQSKLDPALQKALDDLKKEQEKQKKTVDLALDVPRSLQQDLVDAQINDSLQRELKADNAIVVFFQKRLQNIKEGTEKFLVVSGQLAQAQDARDSVQAQILGQQKADQAKRQKVIDDAKREAERAAREDAAAQELIRRTILEIDQQTFSNRVAAARLTETGTDDERVFRTRIAVLEKRRNDAIALQKKAKQGTQAYFDAVLKVKELNGEILNLQSQLQKTVGKTGDGFSLADLFKEALGQFSEFASNVSANPLTPGQVRGQFAGQLISSILDSKESKTALGIGVVGKNTADTNVLLAQILRMLGGDPGTASAVDLGSAGQVTTRNARRFATIRNAT